MKTYYPSDVLKPRVQVTSRKSRIDVPLSKLVHRDIVIGTPTYKKAVHLINKWNNARSDDDFRSVDYLKNPEKVKELKKVLE